jgi:hypothetical protein
VARTRRQPPLVSALNNGPLAALPRIEQDIALARFANLLWHYTDNARDAAIFQLAMGISPVLTLHIDFLEPVIAADPLRRSDCGDPGHQRVARGIAVRRRG